MRRFASVFLIASAICSGASALVRETPVAREILFARNSAALSADSKRTLDEAAGLLAPNPTASVTLRGFASGEARAETLARRRAEAAAAHLSSKGISPARTRVEVGGVETAVGPAAAPHRRVEVTVILREEIPAPRVTLRAEPAQVWKGDAVHVTWTTEGADTVVLLPLGVVARSGDREMTPDRSMAYTLVAFGPGGEARAVQGVAVRDPPAPVVSIRVDPPTGPSGAQVNLSWTSADADGVHIDGIGDVPLLGSRVVVPEATTRYRIHAVGRGGSATSEAAYTAVLPEPPRVFLWAEPEVAREGRTRLYWMSERAESVRIDGVGTLPPHGRREVTVAATAIFRATAIGPGGEAEASVAVEVPAAPAAQEPAVVPPPEASAAPPGARVDVPLTPGLTVITPGAPTLPMPAAGPPRPADAKTVEVAVLDDDGRFLESLIADDFQIEEEGRVREILEVRFVPRTASVATGLLVDRSSSMRADIENVRRAARRFVRAKRPDDRILLVAFGTHIQVLSDFETDLARIQSRIEEISDGGQTALYDALWEGVSRMERVALIPGAEAPGGGPRVLVAMTDGRDHVGVFNRVGSARSLEDVIARARASRVAIFTIGLGTEIDGVTLGRIARETGGAPYFTLQSSDLVEIYARLAAGLFEGTYRITYRSEAGNTAPARVRSRLGRVVGAI